MPLDRTSAYAAASDGFDDDVDAGFLSVDDDESILLQDDGEAERCAGSPFSLSLQDLREFGLGGQHSEAF